MRNQPALSASILNGTDQKEIHRHLLSLLETQVQAQGNRYPQAVKLFGEQYQVENFTERFAGLSEDEAYAYTRFGLAEKVTGYASWMIARLNRQDDREHNPYHMETILRALKETGKTPGDIEHMLSFFHKGDTGTQHPTGYLFEGRNLTEADGVDQLLALIDSAHAGDEKAVSGVLNGMVDMTRQLAPEKRTTTLGEINFDARFALRYNNARAEVLDNISHAIETVFGKRWSPREAPDFSGVDVLIDLALRIWADADGKPNAEYWTLFAQEALNTYLSFSLHLYRLEEADAILNGEKSTTKKPAMQDLVNAGKRQMVSPQLKNLHTLLAGLKSDLAEIYSNIEHFYNELNDPDISGEERARRFRVNEENFSAGLDAMKKLYDGRRFYNRIMRDNQGLSIYNATVEEFRRREDTMQGDAATLMRHSANDLHMDGFTLFKMEPRHNDKTNRQIVDNLFRHEDFLRYLESRTILSPGEIQAIRQVNKGKGFSRVPLEEQSPLLKKIEGAMAKKGKLRAFLLEANPLGFDSDGYPVQTYATLRRLEVMEQYQLKFGPLFVIAEGNDRAERLQSFIRSDYYLDLMVDTPLTEEQKSMSQAHSDRRRNLMNGGIREIAVRTGKKVPAQFIRAANAIMFARSDIQRENGLLAGLLVYDTAQKIVRQSASLGIPSYEHEGMGGYSNGRGAGDKMVLVRLKAQALQEWQDETGQQAPDDIKAMVTSVIATVQGRALYRTESEIAQETQDQIAEMMGIWGELEGVFKRGTFIPQKTKFRPEMERFLSYAVPEIMQRSAAMRNSKDGSGQEVIDLMAAIVSNPVMAGYTNNAARKLSKTSKDKVPRLTQQRAIGNNIWHALGRTHEDEWLNKFFRLVHKALHEGIEVPNADGTTDIIRLYRKDIDRLMESAHIDYNIFTRANTGLARAEFGHGLKRLEMENFSHDHLIALGKSVAVTPPGEFTFRDPGLGATPAQARFAMIYYSAHEFRALTESLLDGSFVGEKDIETLIENKMTQHKSLRVNFNDQALARWPFLTGTRRDAELAAPALAVMDFYEQKLKDGAVVPEKLLRQAASMYRATTITPNGHIVLSHETAYGRRKQPLPANVREILNSSAIAAENPVPAPPEPAGNS